MFVYFVKPCLHTSATRPRKTVHPLPQPPPSPQEIARAWFYTVRCTHNHIAREWRSFELCSARVEILAKCDIYGIYRRRRRGRGSAAANDAFPPLQNQK